MNPDRQEHTTLPQGDTGASGGSSDAFACAENAASVPVSLTYPHQQARLKKRAQFLAIAAGGRKAIASTLVVQGSPARMGEESARVGFTVTKKTGNAVVRNRIRRRLRAATAECIARSGTAGWDYVVIGRNTALDAPYEVILRDLSYALRKVSRLDDPNPHGGEESRQRGGGKGKKRRDK